MTFLEAYSDVKVIAQLRKQLDLPGGLAWINLVGRAHEFHQSGKGEAATSQSKSGNR